MKKFYMLLMVLILGSMLAACSASTANITGVETGTGVDTTTGKATGVATTFDKTAPVIYVVVTAANVPDGTTIRTVVTAVDVTDMNGVAAKDTKLTDTTSTLPGDGSQPFKLTVPSAGEWPVGSYKADIYLNDKLDRTVTFTIQ